MTKNVAQMTAEVIAKTNRPNWSAEIKVFLDNRFQRLIKEHDWEDLENREEITITTGRTALPYYVDKLKSLRIVNSETKVKNSNIGTKPIMTELSGSVFLEVNSSDSGDTGVVRITGSSGGAVSLAENITLAGTTKVKSVNQYDKIDTFSKTSEGVGFVSLFEFTVGTAISLIGAEDFTQEYRWIQLEDGQGLPLDCDIIYSHKPIRLKDDNAIPNFDCSTALIEGAMADVFMKAQQGAKAREREFHYIQAVDNLKLDFQDGDATDTNHFLVDVTDHR